MFEVGFTEIILIFGIALLVLGPERLPKLAADVGRWAGRARAMARQLRSQLEQEVHFDPLRDEPTRTPQTIHTPAAPPPAATPDPEARPDETDESKPA
jgi:sec-independent protein translocase protein TatB